MRRISVEAVLAAYEKTGLQPIACYWYGEHERCGCPLTALAMANGLNDYRGSASVKAVIYEVYGCSTYYRMCFIDAVDGHRFVESSGCEILERHDAERRAGYSDGLAVRQALWPAQPPTP